MKRTNYTEILLEEMNTKFDIMLEIVMPLTELRPIIDQIAKRVERIENDMVVIKRVVKDHSGTLRMHDFRIKKLESA